MSSLELVDRRGLCRLYFSWFPVAVEDFRCKRCTTLNNLKARSLQHLVCLTNALKMDHLRFPWPLSFGLLWRPMPFSTAIHSDYA